jgi:membrane protein required for colicin V production
MTKSVDIVLLAILLFGGYRGFKKGLILEFFSIASLFIAIIVSTKLLDRFVNLYIQCYGESGALVPYILFMVLFIFLILIVTFVGNLFRKLIHLTILGSLDKLMGAVLGIFKWAFLLSSLLWFTELLHLPLANRSTEHSLLLPIIQALAPKCMHLFPHWLPKLTTLFTTY